MPLEDSSVYNKDLTIRKHLSLLSTIQHYLPVVRRPIRLVFWFPLLQERRYLSFKKVYQALEETFLLQAREEQEKLALSTKLSYLSWPTILLRQHRLKKTVAMAQ